MAVVIETLTWEPSPFLFVFLFISCFFSLFLSNKVYKSAQIVDLGKSGSSSQAMFIRMLRNFLLFYCLSSVSEGLQSSFGEFEYSYNGIKKNEMTMYMIVGSFSSLLLATFLGISSDLMGQRKIVFLFCILHLFVGILKNFTGQLTLWLTSICLALASSIFSFSFETWVVIEYDKIGQRQDFLNDAFWLMAFYDAASFIGSQALANFLVGGKTGTNIVLPSTMAAFCSMIGIIYTSRAWKGSTSSSTIKGYQMAFFAHIVRDKKIWLLGWAQACIHFSISIFWILWAPTIVADGREVHLEIIYPFLLGTRMLGSSIVPWFLKGTFVTSAEDCLTVTFIIAGLALSIVAYDYHEIGVLVILFSLFHACIGLILPMLAKLRSMYVPNELRAGMISLSQTPAHASIILILIQGGYRRKLENSTIWGLSAFSLLTASYCIYLLKKWRKQDQQSWHKL